jgi:hypothetical protein
VVTDGLVAKPRRRRGSLVARDLLWWLLAVRAGVPTQPPARGSLGSQASWPPRYPMFVQLNEEDAADPIRLGGAAVLAGGSASSKVRSWTRWRPPRSPMRAARPLVGPCGGSPCRAEVPSSLTCQRPCQQRHQADRAREMIRGLQPCPPPQEPAVVPMSANRASSPAEPGRTRGAVRLAYACEQRILHQVL